MVKNGNQYFYMNKLIAIDKSLLCGQVVTVNELLIGLKSNVFSGSNDASLVTLCTQEGLEEPLTMIYKCTDCNSIHFKSGYNFKYEPKVGDVIYSDFSNQLGFVIGKSELIYILEEIAERGDGKSPIIISCSYSTISEPMTMLYKCYENCDAIHISSFVKTIIIMN